MVRRPSNGVVKKSRIIRCLEKLMALTCVQERQCTLNLINEIMLDDQVYVGKPNWMIYSLHGLQIAGRQALPMLLNLLLLMIKTIQDNTYLVRPPPLPLCIKPSAKTLLVLSFAYSLVSLISKRGVHLYYAPKTFLRQLIWFDHHLTSTTTTSAILHSVLNIGPGASIKPADGVRDLG